MHEWELHTHSNVFANIYKHIHAYIHRYMDIYEHIFFRQRKSSFGRLHACIHVYMRTSIHTYTHTHKNLHTYTHKKYLHYLCKPSYMSTCMNTCMHYSALYNVHTHMYSHNTYCVYLCACSCVYHYRISQHRKYTLKRTGKRRLEGHVHYILNQTPASAQRWMCRVYICTYKWCTCNTTDFLYFFHALASAVQTAVATVYDCKGAMEMWVWDPSWALLMQINSFPRTCPWSLDA